MGSRRGLVPSLFRDAGEQKMQGALAARAAELLAPLEEIAQEAGVEAAGAGFAIFLSPEVTARYYLPNRPLEKSAEKIVIGDHFYLVPFVADAFSLHEFFVLGLSKKHVRLFWYRDGECKEQPLPAAVPTSLEPAGGFDQPDHLLEHRPPAR